MRSSLVLMFALAGCGVAPADHTPDPDGVVDPKVDAPSFAVTGDRTASGQMVPGADASILYVADADNGEVLRLDESSGEVQTIQVGGEPNRIVRAGADLWVTLRASGELVRVHDDQGELTELARVDVGAEPFDVVLSADAEVLYVSLSQEDVVLALNAETMAELDRWSVEGEPRSLAVTPAGLQGGARVYVATGRSPRLTEIDPATGAQRVFAAPEIRRFRDDPRCDDRMLKVRLSGDIAIDGAGVVYVPALYADTMLIGTFAGTDAVGGVPLPGGPNTMPAFPDTGVFPDFFDTGGFAERCPDDRSQGGSPYGGSVDPVTPGKPDRFTPALLKFDIPAGGEVEAITLGTLLGSGMDGAVEPFGPNGEPFGISVSRGYPSSVTLVDAGGERIAWVAMPSMGTVVGLFLDAPSGEDAGGFTSYERSAAMVAPGLSHVMPVPGSDVDLRAWSFLDRQVYALSAPELMIGRVDPFLGGLDALRASWAAPASVLPADVLEGRRLFYTATDVRMSAAGAGVSCETCHTDGRSDGFTWIFDDFPRQTPNLAGRVSDTLPITWTGEVATVVDEVHATTRNRMGGQGLEEADAAKVASYVDWSRELVRPAPKTDDEIASVNRGRAIFQREDVGCATCHTGATGTDGQTWTVYGFTEATNTPTLRGIGGSGPYLHDGSAPNLRDILQRSRDGGMGDTSMLSDAEMDDLERYLKTL